MGGEIGDELVGGGEDVLGWEEDYGVVAADVGACSRLVWEMFEEGIDIGRTGPIHVVLCLRQALQLRPRVENAGVEF